MESELNMPSQYDDYFRPLTTKWVALLREAEKAKKPFDEVAQQLMSFYSARNGFIFEKEFREKYLNITNENELPRHRLSFNKAFEFCAIFGPMLYWDNPQRLVKPRKKLQITPETMGITPPMQQAWQQYQQQMQQYNQAMAQYQQAMAGQQQPQQPGGPPPGPPQPGGAPQQPGPSGGPGGPPMPPGQPPSAGGGQPPPPQPPMPPQIDPAIQQAMSIWDWSQQTMSQRAVADNIRCQLLEGWLNYTPGETPYGGLATQSRMAIVEALVKGRGVLWTSPYQFEGSEKVLIRSAYDTVDNFFMDPDATSLADAKWIAQRVIAPVYEVEEEFQLTAGSLEGKGGTVIQQQKMNPIGGSGTGGEQRKDKVGRTSELITYYKIWSKCGAGTKLISHIDPEMKANIERVSGKYVFLCICPNVDYPLNLPADQLEAMSDEDVRQRLEWPFPTWKDDRWPCAIIDFYPHPNRAWPIAPLAPALGELIFLQVIMSHLADRVVKSSRDFLAVLQSAGEEIENAIKNGGDLTVLKLTEVHGNIANVVQFLQQPETKHDYWLIVDRVNELFERRTGLTELMAGQTSTQSRSAMDAKIKGDQLNVRPEDMQRRVEEWQTDCAKLEKIATRWFIEPQDVEFLFGPVGAYLWQTYITSTDPEMTIRETDCTIEAGSVRKPNKGREVENLNSLMQFIGPVVVGHYQQSGDPTALMWVLNQVAQVYDMDISGLQLNPPPPPGPPPVDPNQQMQMQIAMQQHQMDMQSTQQKQQFDAQMLQTKGGMDAQKFQLELQKLQGQLALQQTEIEAKRMQAQADMQKVMVDMQQGQGAAEAEAQKVQVQLASAAGELQMQQRKGETELQIQQAKAAQELEVAQLKAEMDMRQKAQAAQQKAQQELFRDPVAALFGGGGKA